MADLYLGFALIGGLAVILFATSLWISYRAPRFLNEVLALLVVAGMFFYIQHLWYNVRLATILPTSNLIVVGNWLPLVAGILGGLAWRPHPQELLQNLRGDGDTEENRHPLPGQRRGLEQQRGERCCDWKQKLPCQTKEETQDPHRARQHKDEPCGDLQCVPPLC